MVQDADFIKTIARCAIPHAENRGDAHRATARRNVADLIHRGLQSRNTVNRHALFLVVSAPAAYAVAVYGIPLLCLGIQQAGQALGGAL